MSNAPVSQAMSSDTPTSEASASASDWHLKLFSKSVLKQAKLRRIQDALGELGQKSCLDLGSDNGVISYYLRESGGEWSSADLTEQAVNSITSLVTERVSLCTDERLPFEDQQFDVIVVVDMLEHVIDDSVFVDELHRIAAPNARLLINAPNLKRFSLLRSFRAMIGQTDEAHGHLRPGYNLKQLTQLTDGKFSIVSTETYSRFFSEAIDTAIVAAYSLLSKLQQRGLSKLQQGGKTEPKEEISKGLLFTEDDMKKFQKSFRLYSMIYPVVRTVASLDKVISFVPGYMRLTRLQKS